MSASPSGISLSALVRLDKTQLPSDIQAVQKELAKLTVQLKPVQLNVTLPPNFITTMNAELAKLQAGIKPLVIPMTYAGGGGGAGGGAIPAGAGAAVPPGAGAPQAAVIPVVGGGAGPGGGGGAGGASYWTRGLGRYVGPGILIHEALRGVESYQDYKSELQRAEILNDQMGKLRAEEKFQNTIGSLPIVGQAAQFIANKFGGRREIDKTLAEAEYGERRAGGYEIISNATYKTQRATEAVGRSAYGNQEAQLVEELKALREVISKANAGLKPEDKAYKANDALLAAGEQLTRAQLVEMRRMRGLEVERLGTDTAALQAELAGNPDEARRIRLRQEQNDRYESLRMKYGYGAANQYYFTSQRAETEGLERDIGMGRQAESGQSFERNVGALQRSLELSLRARGENYKADRKAFFDSEDAKVTKAREAATLLQDVDKKRYALAVQELEATEAAANSNKAAFDRSRGRIGSLGVRAAELIAQGRYTEARRVAEDEEARGNPYRQRQLQLLRGHEDTLVARSQEMQTAESAARANGQEGVGAVLRLTESIRDAQRDAGGDPVKLARVNRMAAAQIAELQRDLRPQSRFHGLAEYHDAIQLGISRGGSTNQALGLLGQFANQMGGGLTGMAAAAMGGPDVIPMALQDAAKNLNQAAGKFRFVGVIGGGN